MSTDSKTCQEITTTFIMSTDSKTKMEVTKNIRKDALHFTLKHASELARKKVSYFIVGATMKKYTPSNREKAKDSLKPLCKIREPINLGLFAGKIDYTRFDPIMRAVALKDETGLMEEGDYRDWDFIRKWALSLEI